MANPIAGTNIASIYKEIDTLGGKTTTEQATLKGTGLDTLLHQKANSTFDILHNAESAVLLAAEGKIEEQRAAELMNEADIALQEFKAVWEKMLQAVNELSRVGM